MPEKENDPVVLQEDDGEIESYLDRHPELAEIASDDAVNSGIVQLLELLRRETGIPASWKLTLLIRDPANAENEMFASQDEMSDIRAALDRVEVRQVEEVRVRVEDADA